MIEGDGVQAVRKYSNIITVLAAEGRHFDLVGLSLLLGMGLSGLKTVSNPRFRQDIFRRSHIGFELLT